MRQAILFFCLFMTVSQTFSQEIINGWYFFPEPASNVFGIGYHEPKKGNALSYAGNIKDVSDEDLVILKGPQSTKRFITNLNNLVFTSLFNSNKAVDYTIYYTQLKQVILKSEIFKDFDDGNYYVTQALKADSVVIKGYVKKGMGSTSTDAESLISAFAGQATVAFKVVSTLSNKDTTKRTGILSYSKSNKDSFTIIITDPDVYFAAKLTKIENVGDINRNIEIGREDESISGIGEEPTDLIYWSYQIKRGLDVGVRFYVKDGTGTAEVYEHYAGKPYKIISTRSKQITTSPVKFLVEGSSLSPNISVGRRKSVDYLITAIASFNYDPKSKTVKLDGKDSNGMFTTAVYHVTGKYTTWPK